MFAMNSILAKHAEARKEFDIEEEKKAMMMRFVVPAERGLTNSNCRICALNVFVDLSEAKVR